MAELQKLQDLFDMGFIGEEEFLLRKAELGFAASEPTPVQVDADAVRFHVFCPQAF